MAVAGFVTDRLPSARRPRRALPPFIASVLLHAMVLLLLIVGIRLRPREPEWLPPPAMDMVFEGGAKQAPTVPNHAPQQPNLPPSPPPALPIPPAQPAPPAPPMPRAPPAPKPASPPATPPAQTVPPPAERALPPAPAPVPRPPPEAAPAKPAPQIRTVPPPVAPPIALPAPPPTSLPAEPVPVKPPSAPPPVAKPAPEPPQPPMESSIQLVPPPPLPLQPFPLQPPAPQARPAPPRPRARPAPHFPAPMAYSFGAPVHADPSAPRPLGRRPGLELSFAPVGRFSDKMQPDARSDDPDVGPDWLNLVSAWWQRHAWYPPEAGENNQQGDVTVRLIVAHDGRVESVQLEDRSGKPFLDMGAVAIFRGATLPPLPSRVKSQSIPVHFTIHYIIVG